MENKGVLSQVINFVLYAAIHILVMNKLPLYNTAFCYIYVAFLILLPVNTSRTVELFIGFGTGLFIDIFYDSIGINAAACVALAFVRPYVIQLLSGKHSFEGVSRISIQETGIQWFFIYAGSLLFLHHLILFFIDTSSSQFIFSSIVKAFFSALYTLVTIIIFQYLLATNTQRR
ncbi:MAG: hypothetical protein GY827_02560 [Cytophagales bacterium]|nr:hypothetical protein [Cytophagales bacterium]